MPKYFARWIFLMQVISICLSISSSTFIGSYNHPDMGALAWAGMFIIISYQIMWLDAKEHRKGNMAVRNAS